MAGLGRGQSVRHKFGVQSVGSIAVGELANFFLDFSVSVLQTCSCQVEQTERRNFNYC